MAAAHALADRIAGQDPLAVRITKSVFHAPAEAHPLIDQLAQGILFESQAKFDRMQAFLDKKQEGDSDDRDDRGVRPGAPRHRRRLGGGRMGAGIAHAFLINGANVLVVERDEAAAEAARERVESAAAKSIERGATDGNLDEMARRLSVTVDYDDFTDRQLVVEAVPEDWDLKVTSLRGSRKRLADGAYLASNTSSLSVNGLARELQRPQNFLGLHFFNPVPAATLIEVVLGEQTVRATWPGRARLGRGARQDRRRRQ